MRRQVRFSVMVLAIGASLAVLPSVRADDAAKPDELLQEGTKLAKACQEPKPNWGKKKVSGNFDTCNDALQAFVKAIDLSKKDAKTVETVLPQLTTVNINMAASAVRIGQHYTDSENREAALGFFRVACTSFEASSSFAKPTVEQAAKMKTIVADAEEALQGYHRTCKDVAAAQSE